MQRKQSNYADYDHILSETTAREGGNIHKFAAEADLQIGGDLASTRVTELEVHAERVVTLVKQSLQLDIVANDENYALAA